MINQSYLGKISHSQSINPSASFKLFQFQNVLQFNKNKIFNSLAQSSIATVGSQLNPSSLDLFISLNQNLKLMKNIFPFDENSLAKNLNNLGCILKRRNEKYQRQKRGYSEKSFLGKIQQVNKLKNTHNQQFILNRSITEAISKNKMILKNLYDQHLIMNRMKQLQNKQGEQVLEKSTKFILKESLSENYDLNFQMQSSLRKQQTEVSTHIKSIFQKHQTLTVFKKLLLFIQKLSLKHPLYKILFRQLHCKELTYNNLKQLQLKILQEQFQQREYSMIDKYPKQHDQKIYYQIYRVLRSGKDLHTTLNTLNFKCYDQFYKVNEYLSCSSLQQNKKRLLANNISLKNVDCQCLKTKSQILKQIHHIFTCQPTIEIKLSHDKEWILLKTISNNRNFATFSKQVNHTIDMEFVLKQNQKMYDDYRNNVFKEIQNKLKEGKIMFQYLQILFWHLRYKQIIELGQIFVLEEKIDNFCYFDYIIILIVLLHEPRLFYLQKIYKQQEISQIIKIIKDKLTKLLTTFKNQQTIQQLIQLVPEDCNIKQVLIIEDNQYHKIIKDFFFLNSDFNSKYSLSDQKYIQTSKISKSTNRSSARITNSLRFSSQTSFRKRLFQQFNQNNQTQVPEVNSFDEFIYFLKSLNKKIVNKQYGYLSKSLSNFRQHSQKYKKVCNSQFQWMYKQYLYLLNEALELLKKFKPKLYSKQKDFEGIKRIINNQLQMQRY